MELLQISLQVGDCWVWSLIILFILYHSIGPMYLNGVTMPPVVKNCLGGPRGAVVTLWSPPLVGGFGGSAPEAKNRCKIALQKYNNF